MPEETKLPAADNAPTTEIPPPDDATLSIGFDAEKGILSDAEALRRRLGIILSDEALIHIYTYARKQLHRQPTVGEVRLSDALSRIPSAGWVADRHTVGELLTDSPTIAETWADMMDKHASLSVPLGEGIIPPAALSDLLTLTTRYLRRTSPPRRKKHHPAPDMAVLTTPEQEARAIAAGYGTEARVLTTEGDTVTVMRRLSAPLPEIAPRSGDLILYCRGVPLSELAALVDSQRHRATPDIGELRTIADASLLDTALELAPGLELYAYRLLPEAQAGDRYLPMDRLCGQPHTVAGKVDLLLRTPARRAYYLTEDLKRRGLSPVALGQVIPGARLVLRLRDTERKVDVTAVHLHTAILRDLRGLTARSYRLARTERVSPAVVHPSLARLPGAVFGEDGVTPIGSETVALTTTSRSAVSIPEIGLALGVATARVDAAGVGFEAARCAVRDALAAVGDAVDTPFLTVRLAVEGRIGALTVETVCGLYRVAAEEGLSLTDPALTLVPSPHEALRLTVIAWGQVGEDADIPADRQWSMVDVHRTADVPTFLLPVLRRSMEGSLKALMQALCTREYAHCHLQPVAIERVELPASEALHADTEAVPAPPTETHEVLHEESFRKLLGQLTEKTTPIFAMSRTDAHLLLAREELRARLDRHLATGGRFIVLGEACATFAAYGYLPEALATLRTIPFTGTVRVDYPALTDASPADRMIRGLLMAPHEEIEDALCTLTLPDKTVLPDGFVGRAGSVLGLLDGVDHTLEPLLRRLFAFKNTNTGKENQP